MINLNVNNWLAQLAMTQDAESDKDSGAKSSEAKIKELEAALAAERAKNGNAKEATEKAEKLITFDEAGIGKCSKYTTFVQTKIPSLKDLRAAAEEGKIAPAHEMTEAEVEKVDKYPLGKERLARFRMRLDPNGTYLPEEKQEAHRTLVSHFSFTKKEGGLPRNPTDDALQRHGMSREQYDDMKPYIDVEDLFLPAEKSLGYQAANKKTDWGMIAIWNQKRDQDYLRLFRDRVKTTADKAGYVKEGMCRLQAPGEDNWAILSTAEVGQKLITFFSEIIHVNFDEEFLTKLQGEGKDRVAPSVRISRTDDYDEKSATMMEIPVLEGVNASEEALIRDAVLVVTGKTDRVQTYLFDVNKADAENRGLQIETAGLTQTHVQQILAHIERILGEYKQEQMLELAGVADKESAQAFQARLALETQRLQSIATTIAKKLQDMPKIIFRNVPAMVREAKKNGGVMKFDSWKIPVADYERALEAMRNGGVAPEKKAAQGETLAAETIFPTYTPDMNDGSLMMIPDMTPEVASLFAVAMQQAKRPHQIMVPESYDGVGPTTAALRAIDNGWVPDFLEDPWEIGRLNIAQMSTFALELRNRIAPELLGADGKSAVPNSARQLPAKIYDLSVQQRKELDGLKMGDDSMFHAALSGAMFGILTVGHVTGAWRGLWRRRVAPVLSEARIIANAGAEHLLWNEQMTSRAEEVARRAKRLWAERGLQLIESDVKPRTGIKRLLFGPVMADWNAAVTEAERHVNTYDQLKAAGVDLNFDPDAKHAPGSNYQDLATERGLKESVLSPTERRRASVWVDDLYRPRNADALRVADLARQLYREATGIGPKEAIMFESPLFEEAVKTAQAHYHHGAKVADKWWSNVAFEMDKAGMSVGDQGGLGAGTEIVDDGDSKAGAQEASQDASNKKVRWTGDSSCSADDGKSTSTSEAKAAHRGSRVSYVAAPELANYDSVSAPAEATAGEKAASKASAQMRAAAPVSAAADPFSSCKASAAKPRLAAKVAKPAAVKVSPAARALKARVQK